MRKLLFALLLFLVTACAATASSVSEKEMSRASADLHRLSYAVQGEIMRGAMPGDDLMSLACGRDPTLCSAMSDFFISVKRDGDNAVLLLCTVDKQRALLEDIACTPQIDFKPWDQGDLPCVFTLDASRACF